MFPDNAVWHGPSQSAGLPECGRQAIPSQSFRRRRCHNDLTALRHIKPSNRFVLPMKMKTLLGIVVACAFTSCVSTHTKILRECPDLASEDGTTAFRWQHRPGPDFDVWYGRADSGGVGVYWGGHPMWEEWKAWPTVSGTLGTFAVDWHVQPDRKSGSYHTCLIPYRKTILKEREGDSTSYEFLHVWVYGPDAQTVSEVKGELSRARLLNKQPEPDVLDFRKAMDIPAEQTPAGGVLKAASAE